LYVWVISLFSIQFLKFISLEEFNVNCPIYFSMSFCVSLPRPTMTAKVRIAAGGGFENRLPGGNAEKKCDYKIIEKFLRKSQAPNQS
jgi:hypothetical protein